MDRAVCIHGHFYQPPRENAWLEFIQVQNSARPFHDWNCRTTAECYRPNTAARILNGEGRIVAIRNNYASISFDFGPTLLSWMEAEAPDTYRAILQADRDSQAHFGAHGSAMAQAYNHMIMPLANERDRVTQTIWGLRDFQHRFGRQPEGMWLPETAVDIPTLEALAQQGIAFTVLAPHQARRVRRIGSKTWKDLAPASINTAQAYRAPLPSGKSIALFFYDGGVAHDIAFGDLLTNGANFAQRLLSGFDGRRARSQLVHFATDGETYGHHHRFGEMGLAYALAEIEKKPGVRLTNYGEFLAKFPPAEEVEIIENTSWSCAHGVERWRSDCGCNAGSHAGWHQRWRGPMRAALDWLRDGMTECFEREAAPLLNDPWTARNDYIEVILDRSDASADAFFRRNGRGELDPERRGKAIKLLEMQRHAQLMYTSCGWFFDDISGLETVQVLQYAARALELCRETGGPDLESDFVARLQQAPGNHPDASDGRQVYEKYVKPSRVDNVQLAASFALRLITAPDSITEDRRIGAFEFDLTGQKRVNEGPAQLDLGALHVRSCITGESGDFTVAALDTGGEDSCVAVRPGADGNAVAERLAAAHNDGADAARAALAQTFDNRVFQWTDVLPDEQRRFIEFAEAAADEAACAVDGDIHRRFGGVLRRLREESEPVPPRLRAATECDLRSVLLRGLRADVVDEEKLSPLVAQAHELGLAAEPDVQRAALAALNAAASRIEREPANPAAFSDCRALIRLARTISPNIDLWRPQNVVFALLRHPAPAGTGDAKQWHEALAALADELSLAHAEAAVVPGT